MVMRKWISVAGSKDIGSYQPMGWWGLFLLSEIFPLSDMPAYSAAGDLRWDKTDGGFSKRESLLFNRPQVGDML